MILDDLKKIAFEGRPLLSRAEIRDLEALVKSLWAGKGEKDVALIIHGSLHLPLSLVIAAGLEAIEECQ